MLKILSYGLNRRALRHGVRKERERARDEVHPPGGECLDLTFFSTGESQHVFLETGSEGGSWVYKFPAAFGYILPFKHVRQRFRPINRLEQLIRLVAIRLPRFFRIRAKRWRAARAGTVGRCIYRIAAWFATLCQRLFTYQGVALLSRYCRHRNQRRFLSMLDNLDYLSRHTLDDIMLPYRSLRQGQALLRVEGQTIRYRGPILVQRRASFFERPSNFYAFEWDELIEAEHRLWRHGVGFGTFAETVGPKNWALMDGHIRLADTGSLTRDFGTVQHTLRRPQVEKKLRNAIAQLRKRGEEEGAEEYFRYVIQEINREKLEQLWRTGLTD